MEEKKEILACLVPTSDGQEIMPCEGYEIKQDGAKFYLVKKRPQYPKNYGECCEVLGLNTMDNDAQGYKSGLIICFQELLIARNAYWRIAGDWRPNWTDTLQSKWSIDYYDGENILCRSFHAGRFLTFPTEEMRDAFYKNFERLIDQCSELL